MRYFRWYVRMGSQIPYTGDKYESRHSSPSPVRKNNSNVKPTNTNAREPSQADRLKLLFRDHRGYKTLSEQKVSEWLSKNKKFYTVMPKDLTEIPEQIFFPPSQKLDFDSANDASQSDESRNEVSGYNYSQTNVKSSEAALYRRNRDKMNHYTSKGNDGKHHTNHSAAVFHKTNGHHRTSRSIGKRSKVLVKTQEDKKDASTTFGSISTKMFNDDSTTSNFKRLKHIIRRDAHSLAQRSSRSVKRQSEPWPLRNVFCNAGRTLPRMVQNNAHMRDRTTDTIDSQASTRDRHGHLARERRMLSLTKNINEKQRPHAVPIVRDVSLHDPRKFAGNMKKAASQTALFCASANLRRLQKITSLWLNEK